MKGLSIEEKAARYDEALAWIRDLYPTMDGAMKEDAEHYFPELKEREEEYKRWLINLVKGHIEWLKDRINEQLSNGLIYQGELNKALEALDWLEKQGQVKESQIFQHEIGTCKENGDSLTSEDEKIRKGLIRCVKGNMPDNDFRKKYIAWLERKGAKVSAIEGFETEFERQVSHLIASAINKEYEYNQGYVKWTANALLNYAKHELKKQGKHDMGISEATKQELENNLNKALEKETSESWNEFLDEQKPADKVEPKFKVGDIIRHKKQGFTCKITAIDTEYRVSECSGTHLPFYAQDAYELVEQKSTDKVEPKFKVGDWITNGKYTWQIVNVTELDYILQSQEGNKVEDTISHVDEQFHVFSIQDAKDGDVLVASDGSIFLFAGVVDCGCKYYIALTTNGSVIFNKGLKHFWETSRVVLPATKKQRDLLFQKMKEAGYEWDAEKKELKKIEQKPAWSEEDEVALGDALWAIQQSRTIAKDENDMGNLWFAECWLKSLKERYTWKPSDEQMEALYTYIYNPQYINNSEDERIKLVISLYEQLKRL